MNQKISDKISKINDLNLKEFIKCNNEQLKKIEIEIARLLSLKDEKSNLKLVEKQYKQTLRYKNLKKWSKSDYICGLLDKNIKTKEIFLDDRYQFLINLDKNLAKLDFFPKSVKLKTSNYYKNNNFYGEIIVSHRYDALPIFSIEGEKASPEQCYYNWSKYLDKIYELSSKEDKLKMGKIFYYITFTKVSRRDIPNCIKQILLLS